MGYNQMGFAGQPVSSRVATFLQNTGQSITTAVQGSILDIGLAPGQTVLIPAGQWITFAGAYCDVQFFDQSQQRWLGYSALDAAPLPITSDGTNVRFVNSSGCPIGAVITNAGTTLGASYPVTLFTPTGSWVGGTFTAGTPALVAVPNLGGSTWNTFIGGAINTTVAITNAGAGYTVAPKIVVVPPAGQGSQPFISASAICTISGGAINAVTVTNQGAGYVSPPTFLILNQPGDITGAGGVLTPALTGAGQATAIVNATYGTVQTAVVTMTFTGSAVPSGMAATVLMNFTLTSTAGSGVTAGSGYTNGYTLALIGGTSTATAIYVNPAIEKGICAPVAPYIWSASTTVVAVNNAASNLVFGGTGIQTVPGLQGVGLASTGFITTPGVGGVNDMSFLYPV